ncbi:MAG: dUTP diphosphatase [Candidatus Lernaella stagnicola]|nr:dUTP diphosphatase [Candidatus Lernaella stagnicola]
MKKITVAVQRLPHAADLPLPAYQTTGAAGLDLVAALEAPLILAPGERTLVPTGLIVAIPPGYEAQIRMRSGLALRHGLVLPNAPGTIDSDYRGEIKIIVANLGTESFTLRRGERLAQMVVAPVVQLEWEETDDLPGTDRGTGGFGHTGQ